MDVDRMLMNALRRVRAGVVAVFLLLLLPVTAAVAGQWCATSECPGCAAHGFGSGHGKECFASRESCEARLRQVLSEPHGGVSYSSCSEEGGSGGGGSSAADLSAASAAAAPGHQMDPYINEAISRGINGDISAGDAMGLVGMGMIGNALLTPRDPAQEAARRAAAQAAAAEAARQQAIAEEERKNRLLSGMLDVDASTTGSAPSADNPLGLMTDDEADSVATAPADAMPPTEGFPSAPPPAADNPLGLMMDDDASTQGFMPNHPARRQPNAQPPAVQVNTGPYSPPGRPAPPPQASAPKGNAPPPPPRPDPAILAGAFNQGFVHGSQCYSSSAGPYCSAAGADTQACVSNYAAGYQQGEVLKRLQLQQARTAGAQDRPGGRNNSFGSPATQGPCRTQLIDAYNEGFR